MALSTDSSPSLTAAFASRLLLLLDPRGQFVAPLLGPEHGLVGRVRGRACASPGHFGGICGSR
jgi:hypothetical protein